MDSEILLRSIATDLCVYDRKSLNSQVIIRLSRKFDEDLHPSGLVLAKKEYGRYTVYRGSEIVEAAKKANFTSVKAIVGEIPDDYIGSINYSDLKTCKEDPIDEAIRFQKTMKEKGLSIRGFQKEYRISSASHVANTLRLLKLPRKIQNLVRTGEIKRAHARVLSYVSDPTLAEKLSKQVIKENWDVRKLEDQIHGNQIRSPADINFLELELGRILGHLVTITQKINGGASIQLTHDILSLLFVVECIYKLETPVKYKLEADRKSKIGKLTIHAKDSEETNTIICGLPEWVIK